MEHLFDFLMTLSPTDMSVVMFVFLLVDMWTALSLSIKSKSILSKTLIKGFVFNLLIVVVPFALSVFQHYTAIPGHDYAYIQTLSLFVTVLFLASESISIIANYSAANPEASNFVTRFASKFLGNEIQYKKDKHNID